MASVRGSCHSCKKPVMYLRWVDGRRVIVVGCDDCQEEVYIDLDQVIEALGDNGPYILPSDGRVH